MAEVAAPAAESVPLKEDWALCALKAQYSANTRARRKPIISPQVVFSP